MLRPDRAKCTHYYYYFYFIDEQLGLCFMRISTWCPFPAQAYLNGHNLLAARLRKAGIGYRMLDNAFTHIDDWEAAQKLADESDSRLLHEKLEHYARLFCPAIGSLGVAYQWNLAQVEYATDIVFRRREEGKSAPAAGDTAIRGCDEFLARSRACEASPDGGSQRPIWSGRGCSIAESLKAARDVPQARQNVADACSRGLESPRARCPEKN